MENVTCACGHTASLLDFTWGLPWGVFRCPKCRLAWKRQVVLMGGGKSRVKCVPAKITRFGSCETVEA